MISSASPAGEPLASRWEERRFVFKLAGLFLAVVLLFLAALAWRGGVNTSRFPRVQLPDGSWLVAQAVTVGKKHSIEIPYPLEMQFSRWRRSFTDAHSTSTDRMVIWLTRENAKGSPLDLEWFCRAEIAVSDNFTLSASNFHTQHQYQYGSSGSGTGNSGFSDAKPLAASSKRQDVALARCEFPLVRPQPGKLRLNVYDGTKSVVAVLEIPYPKLPVEPVDDWQIEPLPVTKSAGNLDVTLKSVEFRRDKWNHGALSVNPRLEFVHGGKPSQTWYSHNEMLDVLGNQSYAYQCELSPLEPVWKLRLTMSQGNNGRFLSDETGSLPTLTLTPAKQLALLSHRITVNGAEVRVVGLGGQGPVEFTLPSSNSSFKTKAYEPGQQASGMSSSCSGNRCDVEFYSGLPFLITQNAAASGQTVMLTAKDQDGNELPLHGSSSTGDLMFWFFDPKPTSTSITFGVIVQQQRQVEFFIAPPKPDEVKKEQ